MNLRRLTDQGVEQFRQFLERLRLDPQVKAPIHLLEDTSTSEALPVTIQVEYRPFETRLELARYLHETLTDRGLINLDNDIGLWTWLTLFFFGQLCPVGSKPGKDHRYIPEIEDYSVNYRHLLRNPYLIYRAHADEPDCLRLVLANPPDKPGDIYEQIASRGELIANRGLLQSTTALFIDGETQRTKKKATTDVVRRLVDVLQQFDLTFDLHAIGSSGLVSILPKEFNKFKPERVFAESSGK